jgi:hypothetical protein
MNIKPFHEFNPNESVDLLRGLESLGVNEKRWTREQIIDAIDDVDFEKHIEVKESIEWDWDVDKSDEEITIEPKAWGDISVEVDEDGIKSEFLKNLNSTEPDRTDREQDRFILKDIESAFDDVNWNDVGDSMIDYEPNDVEMDVKVRNYGDRVILTAEGTQSWDFNNDRSIAKDYLDDALNSYT